MSDFKGTPGPWTSVDKRPHSDGFSVFSNDQYIAFVGDSDGATNYKENANLIAAAPELLEALQEMVAIVKKHTYPQPDKPSSTWGRMEAAEAAIAKALGQ